MDKLNNIRKTNQQGVYLFRILPAASTYLEKCSLSICPNASDTDGSGHGGWGQEASLRAKKQWQQGKAFNFSVQYRALSW